MFDPADIAPYATHGEFEKLPLHEPKYQLYAGHISGRLMRYMPRRMQLVTINRDPVERAISEYFWIQEHYRQQLAINSNSLKHKNYMMEAGRLFQSLDFKTALSMDTPAMRHFFRDRILHQFARLNGEDEKSELDESAPGLQKFRKRQLQRAARLLNCFAVVGDYTDLEGTALLLAALRGWAAPPPLPRIHDLGAPTRMLAADPAVRERAVAMSPGDCRLFELTMARAESVRAELAALCGEATGEAVDRRHVQQYFATAPRVVAFDIEADAPRNGTGWNLPERDGHGKPSRRMSSGRIVSTLALLDPSVGDYTFFCRVVRASSPEICDSLAVTVADAPLQRVRAAQHPGPGRTPRVLEWRLPQAVVARVDGRVEFSLQADVAASNAGLWLGRMGCVPAGAG